MNLGIHSSLSSCHTALSTDDTAHTPLYRFVHKCGRLESAETKSLRLAGRDLFEPVQTLLCLLVPAALLSNDPESI
jgi:hypothetical protein